MLYPCGVRNDMKLTIMRFAFPQILYGLWLAAVLSFFFHGALKYRKKVLTRFVQEHLVEELARNFSQKREILKDFFLLGVFIFSFLALARPQWGFEWQEIKRQAIDILVAVDTSKSMLTQDVKPNRLERTKLAVHDLLKQLKGDRIGLAAFAGEAFLLCPLTVDYSGFLLSLNELDVDNVPRGGTNLEKAIEEIIKDFDKTPGSYKAAVIITDGDNLEGDPLKAARKAQEKGIKIYTIGVGTKEGELIQMENEKGEREFLKDPEGNFVKSRLNEQLLEKIALTSGGLYVKSTGAQFGLDIIYNQELSRFKKREIESKIEKKYFERFQYPLTIAVILLTLETCLTTRLRKGSGPQ